jgi:hypothetical protein
MFPAELVALFRRDVMTARGRRDFIQSKPQRHTFRREKSEGFRAAAGTRGAPGMARSNIVEPPRSALALAAALIEARNGLAITYRPPMSQ